MAKSIPKKASRRKAPIGEPPRDLEVLQRFNWQTDDVYRDAAEVIHALAYALVSGEKTLRETLRAKAVAEMKKRRGHAGYTVDPKTGDISIGPLGIVNGGPVARAHKRTQEIDVMIAGAQARLRGPLGWATKPARECARHLAAFIVRGCVCSAPSLLCHVPGADDRARVAHAISREPAAIKEVAWVLEGKRSAFWADDAVLRSVIWQILIAIEIPPRAVKAALGDVTRRERGTRGGQK